MALTAPLDDVLQTYTNSHIIEAMKQWIVGNTPECTPAHPRWVAKMFNFTANLRTECRDLRDSNGAEPMFETTKRDYLLTGINRSSLTSGVLHAALALSFITEKVEGPVGTLTSQVYATLPDTLAFALLRWSKAGDDIDTRPLKCPMTIDFAHADYTLLLSYDCEPQVPLGRGNHVPTHQRQRPGGGLCGSGAFPPRQMVHGD